ncbi:LuxR C-terminal-related transcriptional regulator [Salibacterium aidingense]|uniref:LuxR C-terminal-related transcriptional regulator n=1 Tax=Salibacterium aidingense TaxID=384933 RepID=UPI003BBD7B0F
MENQPISKEQVIELLKDYNWMINEIARERQLLPYIGGKLTSTYGSEATMPKADHGPTDPVYREVERREEKSKYCQKLEAKVAYIQSGIPYIKEEREIVVLECMLDGLSMIKISYHLGLSRRNVYNIRERIAENMLQNAQFAHFAQTLQQDKVKA